MSGGTGVPPGTRPETCRQCKGSGTVCSLDVFIHWCLVEINISTCNFIGLCFSFSSCAGHLPNRNFAHPNAVLEMQWDWKDCIGMTIPLFESKLCISLLGNDICVLVLELSCDYFDILMGWPLVMVHALLIVSLMQLICLEFFPENVWKFCLWDIVVLETSYNCWWFCSPFCWLDDFDLVCVWSGIWNFHQVLVIESENFVNALCVSSEICFQISSLRWCLFTAIDDIVPQLLNCEIKVDTRGWRRPVNRSIRPISGIGA